jgi:hypothetical protein
MRRILLPLLLPLAGCSHTSVITAENSLRTAASTSASSERTFRNISEAVKTCYPRLTVDASYYPEAKEGTINLSIRRDTTVRVDLADVKVQPSGQGAQATMLANRGYDEFLGALPAWIDGRSGVCPYGSVLS